MINYSEMQIEDAGALINQVVGAERKGFSSSFQFLSKLSFLCSEC